MQEQASEQKPKKTKLKTESSNNRLSFLKKVDQKTAERLIELKGRINSKGLGRKISEMEIISFAMDLIEDRHLSELQERTYTEQDRLRLAHEEYKKSNGEITLDQFIGVLLKSQLRKKKNDT